MNRFLLHTFLFFIFLQSCTLKHQVVSSNNGHEEIKNQMYDSLTSAIIKPYNEKIAAGMEEVIAKSDTFLTKDGYESTLANFVMAAMEFQYFNTYPQNKEAVISFVNRGGLRSNLPEGVIKVGNMYEIMPFDNEVVILKISGKNLNEAIQSFCENGKLFNSNVEFYIDKKRAINIKIENKPLSDDNEYTILTTDYLANGGDNAYFFGKPLSYSNTGVKLRDVMIQYARHLTQNNRSIKAIKNGRIAGAK